MKKATALSKLMRDLPRELVEEYAPIEEAVSEETVSRVWQQTKATCFAVPKRPIKRLWLIPAVAVLMIAAMVTGWALTAYVMPFEEAFAPPAVTQEAYWPIVRTYDHRVQADTAVVVGDVQMTIEAFTADRVESVVHVAVHIGSTDGSPLSEHTAERMTMLGMTAFKKARLLRENGEVACSNARRVYRTDDGTQANVIRMELAFPVKEVIGDYVLELTGLRDTVQVMEDVGFGYPSVQALYEQFAPAEESRYVEVTDENGSVRYQLKAGRRRVSLCTAMPKVYVDNAGIRHEPLEGHASQLYLSLGGVESEAVLTLVDVRDGRMYEPSPSVDEKGRVTLCYFGVDEAMLPHLFLMRYIDLEQVTRAKGVWCLPFTVSEEAVMPMRVIEIDEEADYHQFHMHATSVTLSDNALRIDGTYTIVPVEEGEEEFAAIYGNVDLLLADGTVVKDALWQGGYGGEYLGMLRYRGFFSRFIDSEQVVAIRAFGQTIELS